MKNLFKTALWLLAFIFLPQIILSLFAGIYYGAQQGENFNQEAFQQWFEAVDIMLMLSLIAPLFTIPLLTIATKQKSWRERFEFWALTAPKSKELMKWLVIAAFYWTTITALAVALNIPEEQFMLDIKAAASSQTNILLLAILVICIIAPVMEELIFRGWLYSKIAQTKLGNAGAIILSSITFTLIHSQYSHSITFMMVFGLGLLLAWVRYKTQNVTYTIAMHMLFNVFALLALFAF